MGTTQGSMNIRSRVVVLIAMLVGAAAGGAALPSASHAALGSFCPPTSGSVYIASGGRCAHGTPHGDMRQVSARVSFAFDIQHCAALKNESDGGGSNNGVTPQCGTYWNQTTTCFSARYGFATIINQSSSRVQFYGQFAYAGGCGA